MEKTQTELSNISDKLINIMTRSNAINQPVGPRSLFASV